MQIDEQLQAMETEKHSFTPGTDESLGLGQFHGLGLGLSLGLEGF